ncbi:hypothetical protein [Kosakonia phage 305]|uniref:Uncharacterized protein n=1 Tax=Kosakonia phage 305 TaxID=2863193 RepID=A0AAE7WG72_9CAUD|nr:hypothetical protein PP421_gp081 [Kosakonia phage 305]QYN80232.1 hypothetical protein [Kosakonia phage 305]
MAALTSKTKTVRMEFRVANRHGHYNLVVEIRNKEIIFRALGCHTECYVEQAKLNPQRIANCIFALASDTLNAEVEQVVRAILLELN